jgi:aminoglycoside 6'-N-acetyltransferase I
MITVSIEPCSEKSIPDWVALRVLLWPCDSEEESKSDAYAQLRAPERFRALLARDENGKAIAFAETSLRNDYVNGCVTSPVGFLEGIYVLPDYRCRGVARQLVETAQTWARDRGCTEFASDALLENTDSHRMHAALGFAEVERVVCFRKSL